MKENQQPVFLTKVDKHRLFTPLPSDAFGDFSLTGLGSDEHLFDPVALQFPDPEAPSLVERFFYSGGDLKINLLLTQIRFVLYASLEGLTGGPRIREIAGDRYVEEERQKILQSQDVQWSIIDLTLRQQILRFQTAARADSKSREAFTVFLNTAKEGDLAAIVMAYGAPSRNPATGKPELRIIGTGGAPTIDELALDIASQRDEDGSPRHQLIYFFASNPDNVPVDMTNIQIPVITHTSDNRPFYEGFSYSKVNWPTHLRESSMQQIISRVRRS